MEFKVHQHRLSELAVRFNLMVGLVVMLLVSNTLLVCLCLFLTLHQRVEVTPFFGSPRYTKTDSTVDNTYLTLMTENFIYARLNVTPETVKRNHERLLSFVDSRQYAMFQGKLNRESNFIMEDKISSHFDITNLTCHEDSLECKVSGQLKRSVGLRELPFETLQYHLKFQYQMGQLKIIQFLKEKSNETH